MHAESDIYKLILKSEIFSGLDASAARELTAYTVPKHFNAGDIIIEKGSLGDWMYLIQSGRVKVHNENYTVAILEAGEVIGELSLLKQEVRSMSVTALSETLTYTIHRKDFFAVAEKRPQTFTGIIGIIVDRLRNQTAATLQYFEQRETELTRLVEEKTADLHKKNKELELAQKYKEQFLANMSHEIRTPMNAIMGMTNLVLDTSLNARQRKYLTGVQKASGNLLYIINEILDFSKIEAGKLELETIDFSIGEIAGQVTDILQHKADEKGIDLICTIRPTVEDVLMGDPIRIYQVLMNLAGNAIKFTEKGSVQIDIDGAVKRGKPLLKFAVMDTGIGIPADKMESIFESFSQASASDTRKYGGTGLGLAISKQLIERMGGRLLVESTPGQGSAFSFALSLPKGSKQRLEAAKAPKEIDGSILDGLTIILADDIADNRIVVRDTLEAKSKVKILEAANGREVLKILSSHDADIILMDVQMPVMNGLESSAIIRTEFDAPKKDIAIIALTAGVIRSEIDKCFKAGMNDYIPKPFRPAQLFTVIARHTGRDLKFREKEKKAAMNNTDSQVADLTFLEEFCEGNKNLMAKYIHIFRESAPRLIERLNTHLSESNVEGVAAQLHGFKTSLMMMGMDETKKLATKIEAECRSATPDISLIKKEVAKLVKQVRKASKNIFIPVK